MKIPQKSIRELNFESETASIVSVLSHKIDVSNILNATHIPVEILEKSLNKFFEECVDIGVDNLIDSHLAIIKNESYHDYSYAENDYVLNFYLNKINYDDFELSEQIISYEKANKGLGQYLLNLLEKIPFYFATPSEMKDLIRYAFWCDMENEEEYAREISEDDEEYYNEILADTPVKYSQLEENIPSWALSPEPKKKRKIPPEIKEIKDFLDNLQPLKYTNAFENNFPGIMLWADKENLWEKALVEHENNLMNGGEYIQICGYYWGLPLDEPQKLLEVFDEVKVFISNFYKILQLILKIRQMR